MFDNSKNCNCLLSTYMAFPWYLCTEGKNLGSLRAYPMVLGFIVQVLFVLLWGPGDAGYQTEDSSYHKKYSNTLSYFLSLSSPYKQVPFSFLTSSKPKCFPKDATSKYPQRVQLQCTYFGRTKHLPNNKTS